MIGRILARSAAVTLGLQSAGCLHGWVFGKTEKLFDAIGAVNSISFLPLTMYYVGKTQSSFFLDPRKLVASGLFLSARLWLLLFLGWRAHDRSGDSRFDKFKGSLAQWTIPWLMQALWVWSIALPVLVVNGGPSIPFSGKLDYVFSSLFFVGLVCEVVGDLQKAHWVSQGRQGGFCTTGLWSLSRHPNYFGEILMWWAAWGLTLRVGNATSLAWSLLALLSPLLTMRILMFTPGTGLVQAEGSGLKRYYVGDESVASAYKAYRENTSILVPLVGWRYVPSMIKTTLLCEWSLYEYKEEEISSTFPE